MNEGCHDRASRGEGLCCWSGGLCERHEVLLAAVYLGARRNESNPVGTSEARVRKLMRQSRCSGRSSDRLCRHVARSGGVGRKIVEKVGEQRAKTVGPLDRNGSLVVCKG